MMLLFTKTRISLSPNGSKVKSQDHSVQVMVQLFWTVCWGLKTSGYSLAYKATEKGHFLNNISRNLWSKSSFLAEYLPRAPRSSTLPVKLIRNALHKQVQSYCSCSQAEMAARSRLLSEYQPIFCLAWFSALELFWSRWKQVQPPAVPLSKGMKHLSETLCCVCAEDLIAQQGRVAASVPFQPLEEHIPAGKAGGHLHQPKSKPVVVIQLWKFPWVQKHGFLLSSSSLTSMNLSSKTSVQSRHRCLNELKLLSAAREIPIPQNVQVLIQLLPALVSLWQAGGIIIICLLPRVVQHQGVGLVGDGDSAGPLRPGLPIHLHRHLGALQDQLAPNTTTQPQHFKGALKSPFTTAYTFTAWPGRNCECHSQATNHSTKQEKYPSQLQTATSDSVLCIKKN